MRIGNEIELGIDHLCSWNHRYTHSIRAPPSHPSAVAAAVAVSPIGHLVPALTHPQPLCRPLRHFLCVPIALEHHLRSHLGQQAVQSPSQAEERASDLQALLVEHLNLNVKLQQLTGTLGCLFT